MIRPGSVRALADEIERARNKFPSNQHLLAALVEEVGELAKAFLENESPERIRAEAIQVACVAIRVFEESDSAFPARFETPEPEPIEVRISQLGYERDMARRERDAAQREIDSLRAELTLARQS